MMDVLAKDNNHQANQDYKLEMGVMVNMVTNKRWRMQGAVHAARQTKIMGLHLSILAIYMYNVYRKCV